MYNNFLNNVYSYSFKAYTIYIASTCTNMYFAIFIERYFW